MDYITEPVTEYIIDDETDVQVEYLSIDGQEPIPHQQPRPSDTPELDGMEPSAQHELITATLDAEYQAAQYQASMPNSPANQRIQQVCLFASVYV